MADEREDPWSYGVSAETDKDPWTPSTDTDDDLDPTDRRQNGRWTSPSLGAYDPSSDHEALSGGDGADEAYFREFGYGEDFGDGRLGADYQSEPRAEVPTPPTPPVPPSAPAPPTAPVGPTTWDDPVEPGPTTTRDGLAGRDRLASLGAERAGVGAELEGLSDAVDLDGSDGDVDIDLEDLDTGADTRRNLIEWGVVLVGAVLLALVLRALVLQAFWIPSPSMESTLMVRDRVLVNKVSYRLHDINRGDIVVFRRTDEEIAENPELPRDVIKRVIALGGEEIEIIDNQVFIDGLLLEEPYLDPGVVTSDFEAEIVPDGHVFVMGDNRELSLDSRFATGPVAEDRVVGRAFFLFWPVGRMGAL